MPDEIRESSSKSLSVRLRAASIEASPQVKAFREAVQNALIAAKIEPDAISGLMREEFNSKHNLEKLNANKEAFVKVYLTPAVAKNFNDAFRKESAKEKLVVPTTKLTKAQQEKYNQEFHVDAIKAETAAKKILESLAKKIKSNFNKKGKTSLSKVASTITKNINSERSR